MSLQNDDGIKGIAKYFFTFSALNLVIWVVGGTLLWWLSRWIPLWLLGVVIVAATVAVLLFGNRQDSDKRARMTDDIRPPK